MNDSLKEFLKKLSEDEELCAKLESAGDSDKAYEIAKTIQEGFTKEEFVDAMTRINNSISADGEINDDDLDLWIEYAKCNELLLKTLQKR